jgi:hypothetical protein
VSVFCRHNRFTADCPICAKGTVLDPNRRAERAPRPSAGRGTRKPDARRAGAAAGRAGAARVSRGVFAAVGPYAGGREVRLERVPGGLRLAAWHAGQLVRGAPEIDLADLPALIAGAVEKELLDGDQAATAAAGGESKEPAQPGEFGASGGRTGELRDELRVERLDGERLRIARWIMRPNRGWELQQAPVMLPPGRFAEALAAASAKGVLVSGSPTP